jgi:Zn-dependent membrane protease YugP
MIFAILGILLVAAITLPQLWVKRVMAQYDSNAYRYPLSGAELARIMLDRYGLNHVKLEGTQEGDHYDPRDQTVRLSESNYTGKSLTAITIAAHEVGHAIQHDSGYAPMALRTRMVGRTASAERWGAIILMAAPVFALVARRPLPALILFAAGLISMGAPVVAHLITLPVEFDASFNRALPILKADGHLRPEHEAAAHKLLKAAAWTYVASSLGSLLNFWKWLRVIRR